ncbi:hypothetical protein H2203_001490 [Taxawa tesnikishii (nom. ined.)]|nr:hypothetical protein H2203_001490 [Dothideales sp. JES 119]
MRGVKLKGGKNPVGRAKPDEAPVPAADRETVKLLPGPGRPDDARPVSLAESDGDPDGATKVALTEFEGPLDGVVLKVVEPAVAPGEETSVALAEFEGSTADAEVVNGAVGRLYELFPVG